MPGQAIRRGPMGPAGPPGAGDILASVGLDGGVLTLSVQSKWGLTDDDVPYYDEAGAAPGEDAMVTLTDDGHLVLVRLEG